MKWLTSKIMLIVILLPLIWTACTDKKKTEYPLLPYPPVIVWDNKAYVVTEETVAKDQIGEQLGEVKRYINPAEAMPEKNEDSTIAPVGSKLYKVNGKDVAKAFAVECNSQYLLTAYSDP